MGQWQKSDRQKHKNLVLDSHVNFKDGDQHDIGYNILADWIYAQIDSERNQFVLFLKIIGHMKGKWAVEKDGQWVMSEWKRWNKKATAVWDLEVERADPNTLWTKLFESAEYAKENPVTDEPIFGWWGLLVNNKRQD